MTLRARSAIRRLRVRKRLGISTMAMILGSMLVGAPIRAAANSTFNLALATTQIAVDNLSDSPDSRVGFLVQMAGRGMATTDPLHNNVAGEMGSGDRVVVTHGYQRSPNQFLPGGQQCPDHHIWNADLGVSSMDVDYFNNEDVYVPTGGSLSLGFDIQMRPHP